MKIQKKVIGNLEKCYSLAVLNYRGREHFLVAAEKVNQCRMYDLEGNLEEVIWDEPGGVMSMVPIADTNGMFLAVQRFYSPNDSADALIVLVVPKENGNWKVYTAAKLPFVHRFDILTAGRRRYLIACTIKSGHAYKEDWSLPGKVYAAELPDDLGGIIAGNELNLQPVKMNLGHNHGYFRVRKDGGDEALVACDEGVFRFVPPVHAGGRWTVQQVLDIAASDVAAVDLDGCGEEELLIFSPFHGDTVALYKKTAAGYQKEYEYPEKLEFLHAICVGEMKGKPAVFFGNRRDGRNLLAISAVQEGGYEVCTVDSDCGPANVLYYHRDDKELLLAANRETDEVAFYMWKPEV